VVVDQSTTNPLPMKKTLLIALLAIHVQAAYSQTSIFSRPASFSKSLQSVLEDYPNNFHNISGEIIIEQGETEQYESTVQLPGAEACIIGRYHSVIDTSASFQAIMFRTEEYEEAAKQYRAIFKQLKASPIVMVDGSKLFFKSEFSEPDNSLDFTVSTFTFPSHDRRFMGFRIDLELVYVMNEWAVNINMGRKKDDTEE
jgi:hypothetical protein